MEPSNERRKMTLTEADLEALRDSLVCHTCKFSDEQVGTLQSMANNVNTTKKVTTNVIIYGMVATVLGGIGVGIKQYIIALLDKH